jgi:hypothetical protein
MSQLNAKFMPFAKSTQNRYSYLPENDIKFHQIAMLCLRWRSVKDSGSSGWDTSFCTKNPEHFIKS